jgi:hypothetical protein
VSAEGSCGESDYELFKSEEQQVGGNWATLVDALPTNLRYTAQQQEQRLVACLLD